MPIVTGSLTDFGFEPGFGKNIVLRFIPTSTGLSGLSVLSSIPVETKPAYNGYFEAELTSTDSVVPAGTRYKIEIEYRDARRGNRLITERLPWPLQVPPGGGVVADLLRVPSNPALVWTGEEAPANPTPGSWWQKPTGDVYEWRGDGWEFKINLRGPAGYNATGAAEDAAALAAFTRGTSGANAFRDALTSTFVATNLPAYAGPRTRIFQPDQSIYNAHAVNTRKARAKLSGPLNASARAKILYLGHSEVAGQGGYTGVGDTSVRLRQILASAGYPVGSGWVYAHNRNGQPQPLKDSRWSHSAGFVYEPSSLFGSYNPGTGKVSTFTTDVAGDFIDIATFGNGQDIIYEIGGTTGFVDTTATQALNVFTIPVAIPAGGTVILRSTTATPSFYVLGVNVRKANTAEVSNAGLSGSAASGWLPTVSNSAFFNLYNCATQTSQPDIVIVELDANEALLGVPVATYKTNMTTLLNALKALPPAPAIYLVHACSMVPGGNGYAAISQGTWDAYGSALYDLADTFDVPLLDMTHRTGLTYAEANANGVMYDQVHPNNLYYADKARGIAQMIGL